MAKWIASLSDGTIAIEGKGDFEEVLGKPSPWQRLRQHLLDSELKIQSLQIKNGDQTYNLPSISPKFQGQSPKDYNYFRFRASEDGAEYVEAYICIEAIYESYKIQLWVDEMGTNNMWVNII